MRRSLIACRLALAAALVCIVATLGAATSISQLRTKVITLERTECYGTCPVYELTIFSDGRVEYEGKEFVKKLGKAASQISREQLEDLVLEFTNIYYFNLPTSFEPGSKHCPRTATDHPSAITSLTLSAKSHRITHYHGCRGDHALELLTAVEDKIDEVVNVKQWTK